MTLDLTAFSAMLKDYYSPDYNKNLSYTDNVLLGLLPKKMAGGEQFVQAINHAKPGNASATFSTAQTNSSNSKYKAFNIAPVNTYQTAKVATRIIAASLESAGAFAKATEEFDNAHKSLAEKINRRLYRTSSGKIGRLNNSTVTTTVGTLTDPADAWNFEEGDVIVLDDADGGGSVRAGTLTVSSVDPEAGTVTFTANIDTGITSPAVNDYLFHSGDYDLCATGLEDWLPVDNRATKLAASFHGVTRSTNPERLGGVYFDGSGAGDLNEVVIRLVSKVAARGGKPDLVVLHTDRFAQLQLAWLSKTTVFENLQVNVRESVDGRMTTFTTLYPGMRAMVGGYMVTVVADRTCPSNRMYALTRSTWKIWHQFELPCFPNAAVGASLLNPAATADEYEGRCAAYWNLGCSAPSHNGVAKLPGTI